LIAVLLITANPDPTVDRLVEASRTRNQKPGIVNVYENVYEDPTTAN
jgi:hypothetical protein